MSRAAGAAVVAIGTLFMGACQPVAPPAPVVLLTPAQAVDLINAERAAHGVAPLVIDGALTPSAQRWADSMARTGRLAHSGTVGAGVEHNIAGENVGVGGSVEAVQVALVGSPSHLANMLDARFTRVGVGVTRAGDGRVFVVQQFLG